MMSGMSESRISIEQDGSSSPRRFPQGGTSPPKSALPSDNFEEYSVEGKKPLSRNYSLKQVSVLQDSSSHESHHSERHSPPRYGNYSQGNSDDRGGYHGYDGRRESAWSNAPPSYNTSYPPDNPRHSEYSEEEEERYMFTDKAIRAAFIRKVYMLLLIIMLFASGVISFMMFYKPARNFVLQHPWVVFVAWGAYPILLFVLICFEKARRTIPWNYIILFLITLALSFMAGFSAARFNKYEVLAAFLITAGMCMALTLFAFQTKWDFTVISGGIIIACLGMLILGLVLVFWRNRIAMIGYSCLGAILGSIFFVYDTQLLMGGHHRYALSPEDYIFAVITLFMDMINIFLMVMNIIGLVRGE